jgi:hypothetical protein
VGAGTMVSGAHRKRASAGDHASADSHPHGSDLRSGRQLGRVQVEAYTNLTVKGDSGKERRRGSALVRIDGWFAVA